MNCLRFILTVPLLISVASAPALATTVLVNDNPLVLNPSPVIQNGRVFVPLRGVFEALGASVVYENGTITATHNNTTISLHIGSTTATVTGNTQTLDTAPFIVGDSTYVPLRFIAQAFGDQVGYNDASGTVNIAVNNAPSRAIDQGQQRDEQADIVAPAPPPPLPNYEQPPCPAPNYVWSPGYWSWGSVGYYWVPGTWIAPPAVGLLWTPGYWAWENGSYHFFHGYWGEHVGFYGGVSYGFGYFGHGFVGGRWIGGAFQYNTAFTHVNTNWNNRVYHDSSTDSGFGARERLSYNGGPGGIAARPNNFETMVMREHHLDRTPLQRQHQFYAAQDRNNLAAINHGRPVTAALRRPLSANHRAYTFAAVQAHDISVNRNYTINNSQTNIPNNNRF